VLGAVLERRVHHTDQLITGVALIFDAAVVDFALRYHRSNGTKLSCRERGCASLRTDGLKIIQSWIVRWLAVGSIA
jgi:hypothetical protein